MAENEANPIVVGKTERGFFYPKRKEAGQVPAELADQMFTSLALCERAIVAYNARQAAAAEEKKTSKKEEKKNTEE